MGGQSRDRRGWFCGFRDWIGSEARSLQFPLIGVRLVAFGCAFPVDLRRFCSGFGHVLSAEMLVQSRGANLDLKRAAPRLADLLIDLILDCL